MGRGLLCTSETVSLGIHLKDIVLGFNPANGQAKVMSERCGAAETPD